MKARTTDACSKDNFTPFCLEITFETKKEAEAFYSVMNTTKICDYLRKRNVYPDEIRRGMIDKGVKPNYSDTVPLGN